MKIITYGLNLKTMIGLKNTLKEEEFFKNIYNYVFQNFKEQMIITKSNRNRKNKNIFIFKYFTCFTQLLKY